MPSAACLRIDHERLAHALEAISHGDEDVLVGFGLELFSRLASETLMPPNLLRHR